MAQNKMVGVSAKIVCLYFDVYFNIYIYIFTRMCVCFFLDTIGSTLITLIIVTSPFSFFIVEFYTAIKHGRGVYVPMAAVSLSLLYGYGRHINIYEYEIAFSTADPLDS